MALLKMTGQERRQRDHAQLGNKRGHILCIKPVKSLNFYLERLLPSYTFPEGKISSSSFTSLPFSFSLSKMCLAAQEAVDFFPFQKELKNSFTSESSPVVDIN